MCLLAVLCVIFYNWGDLFFEELIESSRDETDNDNVRIHSAFFFIDKILANPISFFLRKWKSERSSKLGIKRRVLDIRCRIYRRMFYIRFFLYRCLSYNTMESI